MGSPGLAVPVAGLVPAERIGIPVGWCLAALGHASRLSTSSGGYVRAEGFEPPSSFEHRHLKPACLPDFTTPAGGSLYVGIQREGRADARPSLTGAVVLAGGILVD